MAPADGGVFYRLLFEGNPQPALIFDRQTLAILAANASAARHYGYSVEEFAQKTVGDIVPLDEIPRLLEQLRRIDADAGKSGMRDLGPFRHRGKDGRLMDIEVAAARLSFRGATAILVLLDDVTERTLAEAALWQSTDHLRRIITTAPIILWAVDVNGTFTLSEGNGLSSLGLKPKEVVGRSIYDVYRDYPQILTNVRRALAGESFLSAGAVGSTVYECFYSPFRGDDGAILGVTGVATDLTARFRAEEALRQSEARFSTAFRLSPAALTISTMAEGRYLYVNDAYLRLVGYGRDELVGKTSADFSFWPSAEARSRAIDELRRAGSVRDIPLRVTRKSGELRDLLVSLEIVELDGEQCLLGMSQDVTDRLAAARALEEQRAFLRQVVDINPNFVFAKDRQGRFTLANQAIADAHGTTVDALIGKTDEEFDFDPEEVAAFQRDDLEVMDSRREKFIPEEVFTDAKGNRRWLQTVKRPLLDGDGVANQVLGVAIDITARKRAEEALRDAAQLSREIVSSAADGIFVCDVDLRYQVWNRALEDMTGCAEEVVLGRRAGDAFPRFHEQGVIPLLERALAGAIVDAPDLPFEVPGRDEPRWLSRKYRPLQDAQGKIVGVVGVVRDVTERRKE
ncbi:MAG: PAS domain S-box protein [Vicinamibacteria bacterium]